MTTMYERVGGSAWDKSVDARPLAERYIDHRRLIHSEAKKIGENHFALCSGHHVLIAPLSHANLSRSEHENLESDLRGGGKRLFFEMPFRM